MCAKAPNVKTLNNYHESTKTVKRRKKTIFGLRLFPFHLSPFTFELFHSALPIPHSAIVSFLIDLVPQIPVHEDFESLLGIKVLVQHAIDLFYNGHLNPELAGHIVN